MKLLQKWSRPLKHLSLNQRSTQRGSVMIMTAILMFVIILAVGLCIDVARVYMARTELQNAADAAALAAARELNSGASGIQDAVTRATTIVNNFGFNRAAVTIPTVEFAVNLNGTYVSSATAQANPANIRFVRVTTQSAATTMLFSARALGANHNESRSATAGMSVGLNTICDFFPVAVALDPAVQPGDDGSGYPAPNTTMSLNFTQGSGSSATLADKNYIILEVPDINGNGAPETAVLSAGLTSICQRLNTTIPFHMTPSANQNNGPRQITDGVNTRFNTYANGYGNALQPGTFPPDSNVREAITFDQYDNRTAVTAPNPNAPGKDDRRILIVPIVSPGTYNPPNAQVVKWGAFFLKSRSLVTNPCNKSTATCGQLSVEWIDERLVIGRGFFDPGGGTSNFTLPVLYK
ncbi:MAG: pilus assembly protein TadG-related protein [Pyrinomonadaceae bacterium]